MLNYKIENTLLPNTPCVVYVCIPSVNTVDKDNGLLDTGFIKLLAELQTAFPQHAFVSPSVQNYTLLPHMLDKGAEYVNWKNTCELLMRKSDVALVLAFPNYGLSKGVRAEIDYFQWLGTPVAVLNVN